MKGPLQWPSSEELLPGLDCSLIQKLQPLFKRCVSLNQQQRPSFEHIEQQLASVLKEARAATAAQAAAKTCTLEQDQMRAPAGMLQASLGPSFNAPGSLESPAAATKQATYLVDSPFAAAKGQACVPNGDVRWSPFMAAAIS